MINKPQINPSQTIDPRDLRQALGAFGTGVTVVTTLDTASRPVGVTANSFNSVSLDPPIVLWSLRTSSPSLPAFDACGRFVINVLTLEQVPLSRRFATPVPDKFNGVPHEPGQQGLPVLTDCAAVFECRTEQRLEVGDHILYLGRVEAFHHRPGPALLFCQGRYAQSVCLELDAT
ncbi:flavin reductase family protein [Hydrogenophaga laconesensis]|uniref:3-hydroxy-9,10-secoandrosta-1,3,5(10)-triene-9, 17-dione monooxygenase reductase component n=1 Tax=Hydrogenophaga laconesensis TaxID=1805971 RepID=A0ABU1VII0_9BURK|nr:flavin reductase family protein [Hydrogenophaga laconesensis]MDR7096988.1 3-hydroxy-9,10-secoandrosta-1,3,5(10)-triene-9,17-dione monooxygenase reductase component [Hydrogenophaga laconesensis]